MTKIKTVKDAFGDAQYNTHHHEKLAEHLLGKYKQGEIADELADEFILCLKYVMVEFKPEPNTERAVKFASKVVAKAGNDEDCQPFFESVVNFLLESYEANDKAVRYRTCQLIAQIIDLLGDAELDDDICDRIFQAMHTRLSDKLPAVRVHAINALSRLQDPSDKHCPIIKAFQFLMSSDPNYQVRVECLRCIAPTKRTLHAIIDRTRDVNEGIRRTAYHVLSEKISVKALSISQRLSLLESGLADRSDNVKKACADKLLQAWLIHYQANILDLLGGLDIMSSGEICEQSVNHILSKAPTEEILDGFDLLDQDRLIDRERLSCESVFSYRVLIDYVSKLGDSSAELLEKVLPDAKNFIEFITQVAASLTEKSNEEFEERATMEYILQQLILCIKYIDVSDPVSRKSVLGLCKDLLSSDHVTLSLTPHLMSCLKSVLRSPHERMEEVAGIIADIQMPNVMEEQPVDPEKLHQLKYKLASVNMNLNELSELLSEAVANQNFVAAAEVKEKIGILEVSKQALQEEMTPKAVAMPSQARNDEATKLKCLTIFVELMTCDDMTIMTDTVRSYMDELVIPAIPDVCPGVRNQAIQALGLCCLCNQEVARKFLPIFIQICQMDEESIRVSALRSLFDIVLVHGIECFQEEKSGMTTTNKSGDGNGSMDDADEDKENNAEMSQENKDISDQLDEVFTSQQNDSDSGSSQDSQAAYRSANDLIHMLVEYLDDSSSDIRTLCAEGLAKLLVTSKITSSKLLSRLIILWYNPITEDDVRLRHCLGVLFPVYAFSNRANQTQVEEAFLPTLQVIFDAPNTSPLSDIDEYNVAELLVQLTDPKQLSSKSQTDLTQTDTMMTSHDSLALKICNEIIERDNGYGVQTLAKALTLLDLSMDNEILAKDLKNLCSQLVENVKDKSTLKSIEKFRNRVDVMKQSANNTTIDEITEETGVVETAPEAVETEEGSTELESEEIDSTVLDTTSVTSSRLKRAAANRTRVTSAPTLSDLTDNNTEDSDDSARASSSKRKIKVPKLDDDSD